MSDILADIDDTLADWHGSADSMRWTPDGNKVAPDTTHVLVGADGFRATVRDVLLQTTSTSPRSVETEEQDARLYLEPFMLTVSFPLAEPAPEQSYWEVVAWQRYIAAMFNIRPRVLGVLPKYGFDARYRQRQKNRRKRRR